MALGDERRQQCRKYLGYSGRFHQVQTELEMALNSVDAQNDSYLEADITGTLDALIAVDAQLFGTSANEFADGQKTRTKFTRVEDVSFAGPQERAELSSQGRTLVGRLASLLGCPPKSDVFAPAASNAVSGGNMMKHG